MPIAAFAFFLTRHGAHRVPARALRVAALERGYVVAARPHVILVVVGRLWFGERGLAAVLAAAGLLLPGVVCARAGALSSA